MHQGSNVTDVQKWSWAGAAEASLTTTAGQPAGYQRSQKDTGLHPLQSASDRLSSIPCAGGTAQAYRELDFINGQSLAPDAAVTEFVDMFGQDPK